MQNMLTMLHLQGFKSIKTLDLELGQLNILIGANGAGKSNLISFFKMLNEMMAGRLQQYIGIEGRAQSLLHHGPKTTPQIEARLTFDVERGTNTYELRLFHAAVDTLIFAEETVEFLRTGFPSPISDTLDSAGHREARINDAANEGNKTANFLRNLLNRCRVYHFHDTSSNATVRQSRYVGDNRWLMPDAANLPAILLRYRRQNDQTIYRRIRDTVRLIAPFFDDFDLNPDEGRQVTLNWREKGSDSIFGPHQLSDGTLRAICLVTLLLQPTDELPHLILVDEPELGLHPYALNLIADLFSKASYNTQILISTQSSSFLNNFDPENVITVDRQGKESVFTRLKPTQLEAWLDEYSLGEIWEKNVIGGGPH